MSEKQLIKTTLTSAADTFLPLLDQQMANSSIQMSDYARQCAYSTMLALNRLVQDQGLAWNDLDRSNVVDILTTVAAWELNPNATPREVYFTTRNKKVKKVDPESGRSLETWQKVIEVGIEGDGNDAILSRFGRNVAKVHRFWTVRENDDFTYPAMNGLDVTPPTWQPKGPGTCIRVVYPVTFTDGRTEYYICERSEVLNNLLAHISNNLMNETFGITQDRYHATDEQKKQIAEKKKELLKKAQDLGFGVLDAAEFEPFISSAWRSDYSREQMIIRKMRNNIVKKIPKDFAIPQGALSFAHSEGAGYSAPTVVETSFEELGVTQSAEEKQRLEALNRTMEGTNDAADKR